ncbi:hypothetical protein Pcinc_006269 [Petrolisthes cinctipes]|uniref:SWIM-type domain-containing protein n=1 Tax=Petrolisthes cinctipes TaxID=88211 RepID=A0AAE1KZ99_PETCI|nr:hypothetical protein Pcinc_006269 [Petrolisthes cinctipes]
MKISSEGEVLHKREIKTGESGFQLLKKVLGEGAFHSQGYPNYFITDNSDPGRKAIRIVWPESQMFLCVFHIVQQVPEDNDAKEEGMEYRISGWMSVAWSSNQQFCWVQHEHYQIYHPQQAFNTNRLLLFMNEVYDAYMKQRLLAVALGRKKIKVPVNTSSFPSVANISRCNKHEFIVNSTSQDGVQYNVNMNIGICDCKTGRTGKVCKHQVACSEAYLMELPQVFISTPKTRQWIAEIVLGKDMMLPSEFFEDFMKYPENVSEQYNNNGEIQVPTVSSAQSRKKYGYSDDDGEVLVP